MHALQANGTFILEIRIELQEVILWGQAQGDDFPSSSSSSSSSSCWWWWGRAGGIPTVEGGGREGGRVGLEMDFDVGEAGHGAVTVADGELRFLGVAVLLACEGRGGGREGGRGGE